MPELGTRDQTQTDSPTAATASTESTASTASTESTASTASTDGRSAATSAVDLPAVLVDTRELVSRVGEGGVGGAIWRLGPANRDLDANVIALPPGGAIDPHDGPAVDVLVQVLAGSGYLATGAEPIALTAGLLVWLPRHCRRGFTAGAAGLQYLTVHQHRPREPRAVRFRRSPGGSGSTPISDADA